MGVVVASRSVDIRGDFGGEVTATPVAVGQSVQAGDTVAEFDSSAAQESKRMRRAELLSAKAQVLEATIDHDAALKLRNRISKLHADGFTTREELDDAELTLARSAATLARAQAGRQQIQAALERSVREQSKRTMTAPFDGVVARRYVDVGDTLPVGAAVVRLLEASVPTVAFAIPAGTPPPGPGTQVSVATTDGKAMGSATVVSAQPDADPRTGLTAVHAELRCVAADGCGHATAVVVQVLSAGASGPLAPPRLSP